jgi:hypothetical protein
MQRRFPFPQKGKRTMANENNNGLATSRASQRTGQQQKAEQQDGGVDRD